MQCSWRESWEGSACAFDARNKIAEADRKAKEAAEAAQKAKEAATEAMEAAKEAKEAAKEATEGDLKKQKRIEELEAQLKKQEQAAALEKKKRVQAEKQLRENPKGLSYLEREAKKLAKSRTIFERWRDAIRKKEARKRKSSNKGPGTVTVTKRQILDAFHKHETSCAFSTESNVVDRETDAATRLHKGRGKGSKGFEKKGQKLRKMAILMLQPDLAGELAFPS